MPTNVIRYLDERLKTYLADLARDPVVRRNNTHRSTGMIMTVIRASENILYAAVVRGLFVRGPHCRLWPRPEIRAMRVRMV